MLNPVLSNVKIQFGESFFPDNIAKKYDEFLYNSSYPLPTIRQYFHETIQSFTLPGIGYDNLQITDLPNVRNNEIGGDGFFHPVTQASYPGHIPQDQVFSSIDINITFKNTILNWLYLYECMDSYYKRRRTMKEFDLSIVMMDSAERPMILYHATNCYSFNIPELEFAYNLSFSESKTFDTTIRFNQMTVKMILPDFDMTTL